MSYKFLDLQGLSRFLDKVKALIPVKTSELQNDSGYTTADTALSNTSENAVQNKVVKNALDLKANDSGVVHTTGNENISGTKSFNSDLNLNYASTDVDDIVDSIPGLGTVEDYVHISGAETISGVKTFSDGIVANVSGTATPLSHTHGNLTNDGKIGTTANKPVITGTNGVLTAGAFGTSANTFCEGNDSRLSDARTPVSHSHGSISNDGKLANGNKVVITNANKVITESSVTDTELGYLSGVTSAIQTQLNAKANDTGVVHKTGNETVEGAKTFTSNTPLKLKSPDVEISAIPSSSTNNAIRFTDKNNTIIADVKYSQYPSGNSEFGLNLRTKDTNNNTISKSVFLNADQNGTWYNFRPSDNSEIGLGSSNYRWKSVYADNYYLGTTAFGDIVTHNNSEMVHTTGNESISGTKSFNSDLNLNYANTDVDDIVDSTPGTGTADTFVHNTGAETISGVKAFSDGIVANVSGNCTKDGNGNVITSTYGALSANNTWSGDNIFSSETSVLNVKRTNDNNYCDLRFLNSNDNTLTALRDNNSEFTIGKRYNGSNVWYTGAQITLSNAGDVKVIAYDGTETWTTNFTPTGIYPTSNNALNLGASANRWKSVYSESYYYGTTKWGLDQANVWTADQTIASNRFLRVYGYRFQVKNAGMALGTVPSSNQWTGMQFVDKNNTTISEIVQSFQTNGNSLYQINVWPNETNSEKRSVIAYTYGSANNVNALTLTSNLLPASNNTYNLGGGNQKWKTLNGVNPGALSLPLMGNAFATDVDITDWYIQDPDFPDDPTKKIIDDSVEHTVSSSFPGWLWIQFENVSGNFAYARQYNSGSNMSNERIANGLALETFPRIHFVFPIFDSLKVRIRSKSANVRIFPCIGNV